LACACQAGERPGATADSATIAKPADSLVVRNGAGVEIWFTLARKAQSAEGTPCVERALEIRRGDTRIKVPLLYTGAPPVLLNDSTLRAQLWNHCQPGGAYLVDLRSGQPVRDHREDAS
jgi:uncharacterized lipoprotein NlpE involved in copper resistance